MRASIACVRCRRSKIRCINNGANTTCRSCQASNRQCTYAQSVFGAARSQKKELSADPRTDWIDEVPRPRKRANSHDSGKEASSKSVRSPLALDARFLTPNVWLELYDIFQLHFSADFPFLHATTFTKPLRQAQASTDTETSIRPPGSDGFLLAFLALTSRYHPGVIAAHARRNRDADPLVASRAYATAAAERLTDVWRPEWGTLDDVQGLLMLGLHEFGMCKGKLGWTLIGLATKAAQAMGLQYQTDLDDAPPARSRTFENAAEVARVASSPGSSDNALEQDRSLYQEICRRTFWSCFIMDRYVSSGKYRPQMLLVNELRVQLPASERSFAFAEGVQTLMLHESGPDFVHRLEQAKPSRATGDKAGVKIETGADEGLASKYIRMVELFGRVAKWSCAGGRRTEKHPPWDQRSEFHKLHLSCLDFKASLPRHQTLSTQNTQTHINMKTSTAYVLIHGMYSLCQVMLNREYVPFVPIGCDGPVGPLDPPLFPRDQYDVPPTFWSDKAEECFKSARDIVDLVKTCQQWNAMVETPFMGFALYIAGFVAVYCDAFPWMDPNGHMCNPKGGARHEIGQHAQETVQQMRSKMRMASGWLQALDRMRRHFAQKNAEHREQIHAMPAPASAFSSTGPSMHRTRYGGGLEEYKQMEHILEFGQLSDGDPPPLELVTSRESTSQAEEAVTPGTTDMITTNRLHRRTTEDNTQEVNDGRPVATPDEHAARPNISAPVPNQRLHGAVEHLSNFRVPRVPRERFLESSSTSPTVYTPSSLSAQSPGYMYSQASYSGWTPYPQMPSDYTHVNASLHQNALINAPPAHAAAYQGPPGLHGVQYGMHAPGVSTSHTFSMVSGKGGGGYRTADLGLPAEDLVAYLDGDSVADHAERAAGSGPESWLTMLWKPENDPDPPESQ